MNGDPIGVRVGSDPSRDVPAGTPVGTLVPPEMQHAGLPAIGALVNNDVVSLSYPLTVTSQVSFLTMSDSHGWRIYRKSLCLLLAKAVHDLYPDWEFRVEHSFGPGLYCTFQPRAGGPDRTGLPERVAALEAHVRKLVARDIPIERRKVAFTEAVARFESLGQRDKLNLLRFRNPPRVVLHEVDGFADLAHGPLAPSTGLLCCFGLLPYPPGFVLHLPERESPTELRPFEDQPHLFQIFREHKEWGRILGVSTVGSLNETIVQDEVESFIMTAEALHEKKIARIADAIASRKPSVRVVLVAGPSASGKTTFAKRLAVQLRVNGLRPVTLGTDDYFVGAAQNPLDEHGKPDYEHIEAVDLRQFNADLAALIAGDVVRVPRFNFETKSREYHGENLRLAPDQILIVEGIHGLNPRLTEQIPPEQKFKVYVSALTQLGVDGNNRISTTDNRLMRRIVRDHKYRGHSALTTLRMWPSVRRGEKRWIFPFQKEADAMFNSALDYELALLKPLVEPLLMEVKPTESEYAEARRLTDFLLNFVPLSDRAVPRTSILREYIGGSLFRY